jgi:hypothetical protein
VKIAYLVHFRGGSESGILRKVASQAAAWTALGAEVGLFVATAPASESAWRALPQAVVVRTPPRGPLALLREREALVHDVEGWRPQVVYLRHGLVHPGLVRLARRLPCVIEVNGDDLAEFRLTSRRRYLFARLTRGLLLRRAAGLVFVTHELAAKPSFAGYGRPGCVVANGIDLASVTPAPPPANDRPHLVFVGHPASPWHGLDQLEHLAAEQEHWRIDVIGPSPDELSMGLPNLIAHGPLEQAACRMLLAKGDAAIGSLALHRVGIEEASTLKVREYLAIGLPVILGYRDTDFPDGAPFILRLENRIDSVRTARAAIAEFVGAWQGRRVSRADVAHLDTPVKERTRLEFVRAVAGG